MMEARNLRPVLCASVLALAQPASAGGGAQVVAGSTNAEISFDVAYDGVNFLVALEGSPTGDNEVAAQLVGPGGSLVGGLISLSGSGGYPLVEFDGSNYLLLWSDGANFPNDDVLAQFVDPSGTVGSLLTISQDTQTESRAGLAFNGTHYFATYFRETASPGDDRLYGRLVSTTGSVGAEVAISAGLADHAHEALATDGNSFLAVWVDDGNDAEVRACLVDATGAPGAEFLVDASGWPSDNPATVGFGAGRYLVVWNDEIGGSGSGEWDLFGRMVDVSGMPLGSPIPIADAPGPQLLPFVAFDGSKFLVTWTDLANDLDGEFDCDPGEGSCADIHGRFVDLAGNLVGDAWPLVTEPSSQLVSPVAFDGSRYFMAWGSEATMPGAPLDVLASFVPSVGFPQSYCTAKTNSEGCLPGVKFDGIPSATSPLGFNIDATKVLNNRSGLLFYGLTGSASLPFFGGTLCVAPPLRRTPIQFSGGNPPPTDCSGSYTFDFNEWNQGMNDALLGPGVPVNAQYWSRDPDQVDGTGIALSNAVTFTICP